MSNDWYSQIQKAGDGLVASSLESVKTRLLELPSPSLNWALGGGIAFGKIFTVYGPEQSGKSLIAQLAIAELHKIDPDAWAIWYDAEFSLDKDYAAKLGIDLDRLWIKQTNKPSEIFDHFYDVVWPMMQKGYPLRIMAIDSIKSIRGPKETNANSVEDHIIGDISQLLNKAFRKIIEPIRKHHVLAICVQQVNEEMDQLRQRYGYKWKIPSGQALKHFSDYMVLVEKVEGKKNKMWDETHEHIQGLPIQVGHTVRCKIDKNRTDSPHRVAEFRLKYGVGVVDQELEVAKLALSLGLVERPSTVTYCFGEHKAQGFAKFTELVKNRPELYRELLAAIKDFNTDTMDGVEEIGVTVDDDGKIEDKSSDTAPIK